MNEIDYLDTLQKTMRLSKKHGKVIIVFDVDSKTIQYVEEIQEELQMALQLSGFK